MSDFFKLPDVSFWQDDPTTAPPINFQQMATQTRGVIIRAGQGTFRDRVFDTSWKNAKLAGLLRGSYWFYDSRVDPKRQAEKYVQVLGDDLGEMEMWCDYEDRYGERQEPEMLLPKEIWPTQEITSGFVIQPAETC